LSTAHKAQLEAQLWNIANTLRGKMNADDFRDYILGFIFYKFLSEQLELFVNEKLLQPQDGFAYDQLAPAHPQYDDYHQAIRHACLDELGYFLRPDELFHNLAQRDDFILEDLTAVLRNIEASTMGTESEDDFDKLFEDLDLTSSKLGRSEKDKNALVLKVLGHLDRIDFLLEDTEADVLGDAYEYLIGQFASNAGKKAGEFYTPQQVSTVLAQLVTTGKRRLKSVYDPTCGSGSLLLRVRREVEEVADYYGQELNRTTYNLARMNMIMHGVKYDRFDIRQEDTLERPQHPDLRFEAIVANPPFSAKWSASDLFNGDDRFSPYGRLAPKSKADFAFVQHMIHQLAENGQMAVVLPHGALFRGGAEAHIRRFLIEERNYLDAVIGLPANIFYGTSIPTCILVFKKCREQPDDILFIDASAHFEKAKNQNHLRPADIDRIVTTYRERLTTEKYSYVAPLSEVAENDYNLNIPRYVDTFEEEEPVDLAAVSTELRAIDRELDANAKVIAGFCAELGIEPPF
jgi:type I restriction enzyme M protein